VGFVHGKDTLIDEERVALDGALDRGSWRFATVCDGHDLEWWRALVDELRRAGYDGVVSIEHEDTTMTPEDGVLASARALAAVVATDS
jgi:sugar phosphate isomerase/epimerase